MQMLSNSFEVRRERESAGYIAEPPTLQRIKHWIERRFSQRRQVNAPVLVLQGTRVQSGLLVDLSEGGFGLSKVTQIVADEIVSVATQDGHVFEGRVIWVDDTRAGVSLISQS